MDQDIKLSNGSCRTIQNANPDDSGIFEKDHTVQFLSLKKVGTDPTKAGPDRYRVIISDGVEYMQAMLATQLNHLVTDNAIQRHSVVVIDKLTCNWVQEKRLVIILSLRVVANLSEKIGDPQQLDLGGGESAANVGSPAVNQRATTSKQSSTPTIAQAPKPSAAQSSAPARNIYPIEGLSPYQNNWTIRARVTQKSDIKTWSNQRGEGKLFNVTLMDDTGEIRATAFNTVVDELFPILEEGKVYYISKARVNLAKKKFSNLNNDYELGFERNTQIEECHEVGSVPEIKYSFVPLSKLEEQSKDSICDVIGVVKDAGELAQINSVKMNKTIPKRDLTLVDQSHYSVRLTLWGKQAEQYNESEQAPVIAFKGVKVGEYQGGRQLSMISSSTMQINPEFEASFDLRGWYDSAGAKETFTSTASGNSGGFSSGTFNRAEVHGLEDVKQAGYGMPDKPEYFSARGTIMHIKSDPISYPACPNDGCNKKVEAYNENWRCEKCNQSFPAPKHRYIMSMAVADYSGQAWLQGFNDVGEVVFGMTANALLEIKDSDPNKFSQVCEKASGNTFNFSCRAKQDTWKDTPRIRYGISRIAPLDYKEEANYLRDMLYSAWGR